MCPHYILILFPRMMTAKPLGIKLHAELSTLIGLSMHLLRKTSVEAYRLIWPGTAQLVTMVIAGLGSIFGEWLIYSYVHMFASKEQ